MAYYSRLSMALLLGLLSLGALYGCHADLDDPVGQAEELDDPVRREHAIGRLQAIYSKALADAKGDRSNEAVIAVADASVAQLTKTFVEHPENIVNGGRILSLLQEMRDPRALPALLKALEWQAEVSEDHAVIAARTLTEIETPEAEKAAAVKAIATALERVDGARGLDNRMRKAFIEALGELEHKGATDVLIKVASADDKEQNFLFNILAAQQLVKLADPKSVPAMIKGLFHVPAENPAMRMNDVATSALVAIGRPSLQPLLDTLAGKHAGANGAVAAYIEAVRRKDPNAAVKMRAAVLRSADATYALGKLGMSDALDALLAEANHEDPARSFSAALALVGLQTTPAEKARVVAALKRVYEATEKRQRPQLLVAMRHLYADELLPFLYNVASTTERDLPPVQIYGYVTYAMLANKAEAAKLRRVYDKEELIRPHLKEMDAATKAAAECDTSVDCWVGKLNDSDKVVLRKASNMLARYGVGNEKAIAALIKLFGHRDLEVRNEALYAVDHMATKGSQAAVDMIEDLEAREAGRSVWNNFKREALPTRSRLKLRAG